MRKIATSVTLPYKHGVQFAFTKLGLVEQIAKAVHKFPTNVERSLFLYGVPAGVGGAIGAGTGAIAADKGERGRGALTGALGGALLGVGGANLGGRGLAQLRRPGAHVTGLVVGGPAGMTAGGIGGGLLGERLGRRDPTPWAKLKATLGG